MNDVPPTGSADSEVMAPPAPSSPPAPSFMSAVLIRIVGTRILVGRCKSCSGGRRGADRSGRAGRVREFRRGRACANAGRDRPHNEAMPTIAGIGVLLVNLGTPDAAEPKAVRRYLKEFLSDRRVIEKDTLLWKFVLNGIILPLRSRRKARDYEKIWNREKNKSPLKASPVRRRRSSPAFSSRSAST